ncbi:DUF6894 family protein [Tardiphaga sp.]|jgi:hypothetical protein|uniref:DUF6894 family protein n=1 Tax=Tardiphaga sp. TaxID=1926292 RepID=UPI0037DA5E56
MRLFLKTTFSDNEVVSDPDGGDYSDLAAATRDGREALKELVIEAVRAESGRIPFMIEICDSAGRILATAMTKDVVPAMSSLPNI